LRASAIIAGLNHVTLAVSDLERSVAFYQGGLCARLRAIWPDGAYLDAGTLWLCLSRDEQVRTGAHSDYSHIAFSVDEAALDALEPVLRARCPVWKENRSEGRSLYLLHPAGFRVVESAGPARG